MRYAQGGGPAAGRSVSGCGGRRPSGSFGPADKHIAGKMSAGSPFVGAPRPSSIEEAMPAYGVGEHLNQT